MELVVDRVTKQYKNKIAIDHMSMTIRKGVYGLLGENGAGKTTLQRMICGLLTPTGGEIRLDGREIIAMGEEYRDLLGYLPQDFNCYHSFTAKDFMLYIACLKGLQRQYAKKATKRLLSLTGLENEENHRIGTFSGGMRQRLGIAQALLNDPKILVLDEPTAGLDPKERVRFRQLIAELGRERIVILSTHIVSDVEAIADRLFLIRQGQLLAAGTVPELWQQVQPEGFRCGGAVEEQGTLEDLYLYYFREAGEAKTWCD